MICHLRFECDVTWRRILLDVSRLPDKKYQKDPRVHLLTNIYLYAHFMW